MNTPNSCLLSIAYSTKISIKQWHTYISSLYQLINIQTFIHTLSTVSTMWMHTSCLRTHTYIYILIAESAHTYSNMHAVQSISKQLRVYGYWLLIFITSFDVNNFLFSKKKKKINKSRRQVLNERCSVYLSIFIPKRVYLSLYLFSVSCYVRVFVCVFNNNWNDIKLTNLWPKWIKTRKTNEENERKEK